MVRDKMKSNSDVSCFMIKDEPFDGVDALIPPPNHQIRRSSAPAELLCIPDRHSLGQLLPETYNNMSLLSPQSDDGYQIPSPCSSIDYIDSVRSPIYPPICSNSLGSGSTTLERSTSMQTLPQCPSSPIQQPASPMMPGSPYMNHQQPQQQQQHQQPVQQDDFMISDTCSPAPPSTQRCLSQTKLNHEYIGAKINSMDIKSEPMDDFKPSFSNNGNRGTWANILILFFTS